MLAMLALTTFQIVTRAFLAATIGFTVTATCTGLVQYWQRGR